MAFRVAITDVTNYGPQYCVAGWDIDQGVMIRPEPAPASFWDHRFVGANLPFWPGHVVGFDGVRPANQPYPHATEDVVVAIQTLKLLDTITIQNLSQQVSGSVSQDLDQVFRGSLKANSTSAYIPVGTNCPSLGAIELLRTDIKFAEKTTPAGGKKLRCIVPYKGRQMNFGVTSDQLRTDWKTGGLIALNNTLTYQRIHSRMGLARAIGNDCYVQINGIYKAA